MTLYLKHSYNVPPPRWGSSADIQYAIRVNAEKIYGIDPNKIRLYMPFFWGLPQQDYSNYGIHSTNQGATYKSGGFNFDGIDDYIDFGLDSNLLIQGELSILARIRLNSDYTTAQCVIGDANILGSLANYVLSFGFTNNKIEFWNNAAGPNITSNVSISDNSIYDVAITRSGSSGNWTLKLYINGKIDKTQAGVAANPNALTSYETIGRLGGYPIGYRWNGFIYEVQISTEVYSAEQISLFHDLPFGLYQQVSTPIYYTTPSVGWTGKMMGVINPAKISGMAVANIGKVMGQ